jgi:hypothetical protein
MPGLTLGGMKFGAHTLLFSSMALLCGYQAALFALFSKTFGVTEGLLPRDPRLDRFFQLVDLEKGLLIGVGALIFGAGLLAGAVNQWREVNFGELDYARTMRWVIPGVTLAVLGFQTIASSFFVSLLGMRRK